MSARLHILGFRKELENNKSFLKSLLCQDIAKRRFVLEKAKDKELRILQKLLSYCLRGEIEITQALYNRINRAKKLSFIEQNFQKIKANPNLKSNLLKLVPFIHLFVKRVLKK